MAAENTPVTDRTAELQALLDKGGTIEVEPGTWTITDQVIVSVAGTTLRPTHGTLELLGVSADRRVGLLVRAPDVTVENVTVRLDRATATDQTAGVYAVDAPRLTLRAVTVEGALRGHSVYLRGDVSGAVLEQVQSVITKPVLHKGEDDIHGISIEAARDVRDVAAYWKKYFILPPIEQPISGVTIKDCRVFGGYYGLNLLGVRHSVISDCTCQNNVRGMSIQHHSDNNTIFNCRVEDCKSAGIHLAYGTSDCTVSHCTVESHRAEGEGLLQSYVGCARNLFTDCSTATTQTTDASGAVLKGHPKFHLYSGVHCEKITFRNITCEGRAQRAYIGVESAWSSKIRRKSHRGLNQREQDDYFASGPCHQISLQNITVTPSADAEPGTEVVMLGGVADDRGAYALKGMHISGVRVDGQYASAFPPLTVWEDRPGLVELRTTYPH